MRLYILLKDEKRFCILFRACTDQERATAAYLQVAWILGKNKKPLTDSETVKECMLASIKVVVADEKTQKSIINSIKQISISNMSNMKRVESFALDVFKTLLDKLRKAEVMSFVMDELIDNSDVAQLSLSVRVFDGELFHEDLLGLIPMEGHTTGEILFTKIILFVEENNLDLTRINMLVTDGAPLMAGRDWGLAARMAAVAPQMRTLHCLIHQGLLCAKLSGKDAARGQLDCAMQDVNVRYTVLEETEKRAVCRALIEERARFCSFVSMLKPVLDHEINMLGEVTHLQTILEDLTNLTAEPNKLPSASEQVILDLKGSDFTYTYQTPPASPSTTLSRKSSINSNYQYGSVRHVPSLDSITCAVDEVHIQVAVGSTNQLASGGSGTAENGLLAPPHKAYTHHGERARAMSASGKSCLARDHLALTLGVLNSDAPRSSRDSLHCSSGYSTQTTTPSCSEDTIHTHAVKRDPPLCVTYESISLHGDVDSISLHHLSHGNSQSDLDKSSTIPRNSNLRFQYKEFAQYKRPASTVSLLAEAELSSGSIRQLPSHTATIRRKPSSKPAYRRGTISGGVPIPICTPQVPLKTLTGNGASDENVFAAPLAGGGFGHSKLCTSTQSLSALPSSSSSPYYQLVPGQMPIPVPVPTVPSLQPEVSNIKQQQRQYQLQQQQQIAQQLNHQQRRTQLHQHNQQLQIQQQQWHQQQLQQQLQQQQQQLLLQQPQQPQHHQDQYEQQNQHQQHLNQQQKQKLFHQQHQGQLDTTAAAQGDASSLDHSTNYQPQAPPPSSLDHKPEQLTQEGGGGGGDMLTLIRGVKLKKTLTNDRSAPFLPSPPNHK